MCMASAYGILPVTIHVGVFIIWNEFTETGNQMADTFTYEIKERIAVLSQSSKGWTKEFNLVSWNEKDPKYDIREWSPDGNKMGKGITLTDEEAAVLKKALMAREDL